MNHPNSFDFEVKDGRILVTRFQQYQSRGDCCLEMLCDLVLNWPEWFEEVAGTVFYGDKPPEVELPAGKLGFCTTVHAVNLGQWLPFPCFSFIRYPEIGVDDSEAMFETLLKDQSPPVSPQIFWLGAETHSSRLLLCELGRAHPEIFDASLMEWDRSDPKRLVSKSRQVSIPDHRKYKYLMDCPGIGYSLRLKWLLATGRPVFVVVKEIREPWELELEPWVHYIPVAADLSDLLEHHARVEAEPELYESIGRNARAFAAEKLNYGAMLNCTAEMLWHRIKALASDRERRMALFSDPRHAIPILAVHSSNMAPLFRNFVSSLNPDQHGFQLITDEVDLSQYRDFGFRTESWYRMMINQVEFTVRMMEQKLEDGDHFIVSDIDIHFFKTKMLRQLVLEAARDDIEFSASQDRENYYNGGFIILKNCPKVRELYRRTLKNLTRRRRPFADQDEINEILPTLGIRHRPIPPDLGVLGKRPVHEGTVFYHATFAGTLEQKLARIETAKAQMRNGLFGVWQDF